MYPNITTNNINEIKCSNRKENCLNVLYTNADTLFNKITELKLTLNSMENKPQIIAITEVKQKHSDSLIESELHIPGYNVFCDLAENKRGIIIYAMKDIKAKQISIANVASEYVCVELQNKNGNILISCIYRSPSSSCENNDNINKLINDISSSKAKFKLIVGDFNFADINWNKWEGHTVASNNFLHTMQGNFLMQHVIFPTRARGSNEPSLLDLVISNDDFIDNIEYLSPLGKSDHSVLSISCKIQQQMEDYEIKLNYNKGNYEGLREFLTCDWNSELNADGSSIDDMWKTFKHKVLEGIEAFIPGPNKYSTWKKNSWKCPLSKEVRLLIRKKHRMWTRYMETRDQNYLNRYKYYRNKVRSETRNVQRMEQCTVSAQCKQNPKKFWNYVKRRTSVRSGIDDILLEQDGEIREKIELTDDYDKAQAFNNYFSTVFTVESRNALPKVTNKKCTTSMKEITITADMVLKKLNCLNVNKSAGPDGIHPRILQEVKHEIVDALCIIFNESISRHQIPADWKNAHITVVHKKGSKTNVANYRPISLTCVICKILESMIRDHVMEHFKINKLFNNNQYGFIKGRSTTTQLLKILDDWTDYLEGNGQIDVIYTDFAKAFDKVPHKRLIHKLKSYNIDENVVQWIIAFLTNRQQKVKINGSLSEWLEVLSGIPQGTVLGPLLFLIYINDLPDVCDSYSKMSLFADDAKIYTYINNVDDCISLQHNANKLYQWTQDWELTLNIDKCTVCKYGMKITINSDYYLNNIKLEEVHTVKDLGVTFDDHLQFKDHCLDKIKKAYAMLGLIKRNFNLLCRNSFVMLYKTMVRSHLEYANAVWNPHREGLIKDLERVQMKATKLVSELRKKSYKERLMELKLPTLKYRRIRGDMIEVYKLLMNKYDVHTTRKINSIHAIFYHILSFY